MQTDMGKETPLAAAAHWYFAVKAGGKITWDGKTFEQGSRLKDSYKVAPSTDNVKIEKMWESMLHCCSREWVSFFSRLEMEGQFDSDSRRDQIALYAVFEDTLRQELQDFMETWNYHPIRLQRNRPHVVHGKPWMNYHYPDPAKACNWGIPIDRSVLQEIAQPIQDIDIGTCLLPETKQWCDAKLLELGFAEARRGAYRDPDKLQPLKRFYLDLRVCVDQHIRSGQAPWLAYLEKPRGGVRRYVSIDTNYEHQRLTSD
jgi:hypothetical protein